MEDRQQGTRDKTAHALFSAVADNNDSDLENKTTAHIRPLFVWNAKG